MSELQTSRSARPLWVVTVLLGLAVYPLVFYSGHLYYAEGGTSPDGPGNLIFGVIYTTPIWLSVWIAAAIPYLARYPGRSPLLVGPGDTLPSFMLSLMAFAGSGFMLWLLFARTEFWRSSRWPFTAHLIACALHLQYLRAAAVQRSRKSRPGDTGRPVG